MSDEIKEIFIRMNDLIEHQFDKEYHTKCDLFKDIQGLLDYITNLQQNYDRALSDLVKESHKRMELSKNYDRIYNENCKLRENHNISDISLLDENENLKDFINKLQATKDRLDKYDRENQLEINRLNNIIKDIKSQLDYLETYSSKEDVFEDMKRRLDRINNVIKKENK